MERFSGNIQQVLRDMLGGDVKLLNLSPVSGGSINEAYRLETSEGLFFLKRKRRPPARFFASEAEGLDMLRKAGAPVPEVIGWRDADPRGAGGKEANDACLLMEWLEKTPWSADTMEQLGRVLAAVHRAGARLQKEEAGFGFFRDNFIGELPQPNRIMPDWADFYRECRLLPQWEQGLKSGRIVPGTVRARRLEYVIRHVERWIPKRPEIALLHGDLWAGNAMAARGAKDVKASAYLLDPSVSFGHHEVDLAFTEYFGGFSPVFYAAYREACPLDESYHERKPLYQLYYMLVHLNLFGEAYGADVDAVLRRYAP